MGKKFRSIIAILLVFSAIACTFAGCGSESEKPEGEEELTLEPFEVEWGMTQEEAVELLKCVYRTNEKRPEAIYVMGSDNEELEAYDAEVSLIIYSFEATKSGSNDPLLSSVTFFFAEEDHDKVLEYIEERCGESYFEDTQWGIDDANVYLFENSVRIEYSSNPLINPERAENPTRYTALAGMSYTSQQNLAELSMDNFSLLWRYSTAETDFVKVDNTK